MADTATLKDPTLQKYLAPPDPNTTALGVMWTSLPVNRKEPYTTKSGEVITPSPKPMHVGAKFHIGAWPEFVSFHRAISATAYEKGYGPSFCPAVNRVALFTPDAPWAERRRCTENTMAMTMLVLDADNVGRPDSILSFVRSNEVAYYFYNTPGHYPEQGKNKWRLIIPLCRPVMVDSQENRAEWKRVGRMLYNALLALAGAPGAAFDEAALAPAQAFFYANRQHEDEQPRHTEWRDGLYLDFDAIIEDNPETAKPSRPPTIDYATVDEDARVAAAVAWLSAHPAKARNSGMHTSLVQAVRELRFGALIDEDVTLELLRRWAMDVAGWGENEVQGAVTWTYGLTSCESTRTPGWLLEKPQPPFQVAVTGLSVEDATAMMPDMIEYACDLACAPTPSGKPFVVVLSAPVGVGKTQASVTALPRTNRRLAMLTTNHANQNDFCRLLKDAGVQHRVAKGIESWTGRDACRFPDTLRRLASCGFSVRREACSGCLTRSICTAFAGVKGYGQVSVATQALADSGEFLRRVRPEVLVYDEQPAIQVVSSHLVATLLRSVEDAGRFSSEAEVWATRRKPFASILAQVVADAEGEWGRGSSEYPAYYSGDALRRLVERHIGMLELSSYPDDYLPPPSGQSCGYPHAGSDKALRSILGAEENWFLVVGEDDARIEHYARVPRPRLPSVILDATASLSEGTIAAAWPEHEPIFLHVTVAPQADGKAVCVYNKYVSRKILVKSSSMFASVFVDAVSRGVAARGDGSWKVGVITYKPLAERIVRERPSIPGVASLVVEYYGNCRGSNAMKNVDILVTIGDPVANIRASDATARLLGIDPQPLIDASTAAELNQAQGRARALRRPEVVLVHVGRVRPTGPVWDNVVVDTKPDTATALLRESVTAMHLKYGAANQCLMAFLRAEAVFPEDIVNLDRIINAPRNLFLKVEIGLFPIASVVQLDSVGRGRPPVARVSCALLATPIIKRYNEAVGKKKGARAPGNNW